MTKLKPVKTQDVDESALLLVAAGRMRLPKGRLNGRELRKILTGKVAGNKAIQAVLEDRKER